MNDHAYDISYLLESESVVAEAPVQRVMKAAPAAPRKPSLADTQEAMARELLQAADAHEELIRQYLRMGGDTLQDSSRY
ncbi:hypothetical protein [Rhodanobacter sp. C01]|uniref:hypothetical protein n=1 Tax=Rhodanobacter sp. C01 TaxID=1945856 RepID=UPI0009840C56|nr:hypothetical protein [Rhodanobacter sp. C01]OOG45555.1 hypothetical protein B0E50_15235 [Rhodanobacter sp. C01]